MYVIVMSSDEFGTEDFKYNTAKEAREVWDRLVGSCREHSRLDGVTRTLKCEKLGRCQIIATEGLTLLWVDDSPFILVNPPANIGDLLKEWNKLDYEFMTSEDAVDWSPIDTWLVSKGVAVIVPKELDLEDFYTEEQKG